MASKPRTKCRKPKWTILRFRKNDPAHNLIAAAQKWIHANKGTAVVIGGIGIMGEPEILGGSPYRYKVCISVLGKKPEKKSEVRRG